MATKLERDAAFGRRVTWIGLFANLGLILCKMVAGVLGRSQALVADAVHSVSDFLTDAIVLVGLKVASKPPDADHHFGHARVETLASMAVGISLVVVGAFLGYRAGLDIYHHETHQPNGLALAGAALSIAVKEILYQYTVRAARRIRSQAMVANAWHHRSDALSSVAVLVGVSAALVNPDWHVLDAFAAVAVALLVVGVGIRVIWQNAREVVDSAPDAETMERIRACIDGVPGATGVHDVKVRLVGGTYHVQVHIHVSGRATVAEGHGIADAVSGALRAALEEVSDVLVHVDPAPEP